MTDAAPRVSVIIAAYAPGDGLNRVFASLDAQTMPQQDFEVVVVDDGSPDDTMQRLAALQATRPNLRFASIPNSGWGSRPRNVAIGMARGEYVLFMDHDDALYPDALRRGHEYAREHASDVVSAKESKTNNLGWGFAGYLTNVANAVPDPGISALMPMLPHKLYRRELLLHHDIRFPEGRRVLWEDVYFNAAVYRHARVVSVLADTPFYKWVIGSTNNSSTYGPRSEEFWLRLIELMDYLDTELGAPGYEDARRTMLMQQYRVRVIQRFHALMQQPRDPQVPMAMAFVRQIHDRFIPEAWDEELGPLDGAKSVLLRRDRPELLRHLTRVQSAIAGTTRVDSLTWRGGRLEIRATTRWAAGDGTPLTFVRRGERVERRLPAAVSAALPAALLDVTQSVRQASTLVTTTNRAGRETWALPTTAESRLESLGDSAVTPTMTVTAVLDVDAAAFGRPLTSVLWDLHARVTWAGSINHRPLWMQLPAAPAIVTGRPVSVYANTRGGLSVDLAQRLRNIVKDGRPALEATTVSGDTITVPLPGVHVADLGSIPCVLTLGPVDQPQPPALGAPSLTGALLADATGARLQVSGAVPPGDHRVSVQVGDGAPLVSTLVLRRDPSGAVAVLREPLPGAVPPPASSSAATRAVTRLRLIARRLGKRVRDEV